MRDADIDIRGAVVSVAAMVTLAPVVAVTTLVCWEPSRWGGSVNPLNILVMSMFGVLTVPLWPTYIPAIVVTPFLMRWMSRRRLFTATPLPLIIALALPFGAVAGFVIMSPVLVGSGAEDGDLWWNWATAGMVSGAVTFAGIAGACKYLVNIARAEPCPPPLPRARGGHSEGEG